MHVHAAAIWSAMPVQEDVIYIQMELCLGTVFDDWRVRQAEADGGGGGAGAVGGGGGGSGSGAGREGEGCMEEQQQVQHALEPAGTPLSEDALLQVAFSLARTLFRT